MLTTQNTITTEAISKYIEEISQTTIDEYTKYWNTIKPLTDDEYYNRWIFAFLSVHTSWKSNVKSYKRIANDTSIDSKLKLRDVISYTGVGLIEMRTRGMWQFKEDFYKDPQSWRKKEDEDWVTFRERTMNMCHGIGYAKTAFAIELCYPNECEITCLDTHMLQLYSAKNGSTPSPNKYKMLEKHWVDTCKSRNIPPFMARNVYWDKVQNQKDTRYWSYVFETPQTAQPLEETKLIQTI